MDTREIYTGLTKEGLAHDKAVSELYTHPSISLEIKKYLTGKGLSITESKTLWTDIVVKFAYLVKEGKYHHQDNMVGYLKNLARFMMLNFLKQRKRNQNSNLDDINESIYSIEEYGIYNIELKELLSRELDRLGEMCRNILFLWSRSYSMKEIMSKVNVISEAAVRKRKHKCFKKLLSNIEKDENLTQLLKMYLTK